MPGMEYNDASISLVDLVVVKCPKYYTRKGDTQTLLAHR